MKKLLSLIFFLACVVTDINAGLDSSEKDALIDLYHSTNGSNWNNKTNWLSGDPCENEWYGISCTHDRYGNYNVFKIDLSGNNLTGSLPNSIGDFSSLLYLNLDRNAIGGTIPANIGNLDSLLTLNLRHNQLIGGIPRSIGDLGELNELWLGDNQLSGVIPSYLFSRLDNLKELDLSTNQLIGQIPNSIVSLDHLYRVYLAENRSLYASKRVRDFLESVCHNDADAYSGGDDTICVSENPYIGGAYWNIIDRNSLKGVDALYELYIETDGENWSRQTNWFLGDPCLHDWENVECNDDDTQITKLYLHNNNMSGPITWRIGNLKYLQELRLNGNNLVGHIPDKIGRLNNLTELLLSQNLLTGEIPQSLTQLNTNIFLYLNDNYYLYSDSQEVKDFIDTYAEHTYDEIITSNKVFNSERKAKNYFTLMSLYQNTNGEEWEDSSNWDYADPCEYKWHGVYCNEDGEITKLYLHNNNLSGSVASWEVAQLSALKELRLNGNNLIGHIPDGIGRLNNLTNLLLNQNLLTGEIPQSLTQLNTNIFLHLKDNYYLYSDSQEVKDFIDTYAEHTYDEMMRSNKVLKSARKKKNYFALMSLYHNTNGEEWEDNSNWDYADPCEYKWYGVYCNEDGEIVQLRLPSNNLSGNLPAKIGDLTHLTTLALPKNRLTGTIPSEIGNLVNLTYLDLSSNMLEGRIPSQIGNLTKLDQLRLHHNNLSGTIPANLPTSLRILLLHNNQLTGVIPSEIGSLTRLQWLYLSNNNLYGDIPVALTNLTNLTLLFLDHNYNLTVKSSEANRIKEFIDGVANYSGAFEYMLQTNYKNIIDNFGFMVPVITFVLFN